MKLEEARYLESRRLAFEQAASSEPLHAAGGTFQRVVLDWPARPSNRTDWIRRLH